MDLSRLHTALSTYEVAEHIFKVDNGKTLSEALALLQDANEEAGDPLSLKNALKNTPNARTKPNIVMGANPTKVGMHTAGDDKSKAKDGTKAFQTAADRVQRISRGLATEDQLPDHRSVNSSGELVWKKRNVSAAQIATVKKAALKSAAQRNENHFALSETATSILKAASDRKLQGATAAARTIETHYKADPRIGEVANKIEVQNVANAGAVQDMAAIKWIKDVDTRDALRGTEFAQINVTQDNSFAARVARKEAEAAAITKAAESISRPSQIDFKDNYLNDQGNVSYNRPEAKANIDPTKNYVGPDGKHNFPNKEKQWDVSLSKPKDAVQNNDPSSSYTGAI
jgi:hypothetical protein